jgi:hypothetical protein
MLSRTPTFTRATLPLFLILLIACSVSSDKSRKPSGSSAEAAGGTAPKEPGDTSPAEFEGTAGTTDVKRTLASTAAVLKEIRTGRHPDFDRVVFEFENNQIPGYHVEYIDRPVRTCGAGRIVDISGYGFLFVRLMPAQSHNDAGEPTLRAQEFVPRLPVIKELKQLCDFEADVQWVLGLSSPNRYRVLELYNPARVIIDVRH